MTVTRAQVAGMIDHTLLKPAATADDVLALCDQARRLEVYAVCISPTMVQLAAGRLGDSPVKIATVIGFPSGAHHSAVKADEAALAAADGADEADMVIDLGLAIAGDWAGVRADCAAVRDALDGQILKVILETAALTPEQIVNACDAAERAGADFVKTSTGFHPAGGATVEAVQTMAATVGGRLGIKAAGGIRDARTALALIEAGATRLGLSSTAAVLTEIEHLTGSVEQCTSST
jgi:deoxyribose-phosphate aldolase